MLSFLRRHPIGFLFVFWGELAERSSYYGMQCVLALFLVDVYHRSEAASAQITAYFTATCYILPLLGGWLADRYLGKYRTIVIFSVPYIAGHVVLGSMIGDLWLLLALALLAIGAGAVKPNTSTLMALIYERAGKKELLTEAFSLYYGAINLGAGISTVVIPLVKNYYGYRVALMCPAALMAVALAVFAAGWRFYPREKLAAKKPSLTAEERAGRNATLLRLSGIFVFIALFWLVHDQMSTTWIFMARDHLNLRLLPTETILVISPAQLNAINPILIVLVTPFFGRAWDFLGKRRGRPVDALEKMQIGFCITLFCMLLLTGVSFLELDMTPTVWWMILALVLISVAELCISVVGLEYSYQQATEDAKSTIMATFLLTVFVGDTLGGYFVGRYYGKLPEWQFFGMQALLMAATTVLFALSARRFRASQPPGELPQVPL